VSDCLIVSGTAREFAEEISRTADNPVSCEVCTSASEALARYSGQSVLFGNPDMVASILRKLPAVEWVQSTWAGVKPLTMVDRRDYVLTGVKEVFGSQISEYVMGYLLAHELRLLERMQQQRTRHWFTKSSGLLQGKRLGVMGTGSIGSHVAQTARAFSVKVAGLNSSGASAPAFDEVLPAAQLHDFLDGLDYLVSTLPQTTGTDNLLDETAFATLPSHAFFINVGRGNVVDDRALINALQNDELGGAALDVFDVEPLPQDSPLWDTPKLSITAHIAAISHPSLIVPIFLENYRRYSRGEALQFVVDLDKGY
jgi:phosphoglycerate dehydrogenase-like enzyme